MLDLVFVITGLAIFVGFVGYVALLRKF